MSLIKLASQTVLALKKGVFRAAKKGVFRAAKNDVKSLRSNAKHRMIGVVQGFEYGGIGQYNKKLKNINTTLGQYNKKLKNINTTLDQKLQKLKNIDTTLDQKLQNLRQMKVQSIKNQAALSDKDGMKNQGGLKAQDVKAISEAIELGAQAVKHQAKYNKFKSPAKHIFIKEHPKKVAAGAGAVAALGAAGYGYMKKKKSE